MTFDVIVAKNIIPSIWSKVQCSYTRCHWTVPFGKMHLVVHHCSAELCSFLVSTDKLSRLKLYHQNSYRWKPRTTSSQCPRMVGFRSQCIWISSKQALSLLFSFTRPTCKISRKKHFVMMKTLEHNYDTYMANKFWHSECYNWEIHMVGLGPSCFDDDGEWPQIPHNSYNSRPCGEVLLHWHPNGWRNQANIHRGSNGTIGSVVWYGIQPLLEVTGWKFFTLLLFPWLFLSLILK